MSQRATILQLGDVHFPKFVQAETNVDVKDEFSTPGGLANKFTTPVTVLVARALEQELVRDPNLVVATCGDLTDRGDLDSFVGAVEYLEEALGVGTLLATDRMHLVPGNHDVDLEGVMPFVDFGSERFEKLQERLVAAGRPTIVTTSHRYTAPVLASGSLFLHSVNTARGNGAPRLIAEFALEDLVSQLLDPMDSDGILRDAAVLAAKAAGVGPTVVVQESLDMPLIDPEDLDHVQAQAVTSLAGLLVLTGHHGFLPQSTPRFGPYTEMVNGGQVRRRLTQLGRPVLYLHGHIHEDSLEIVRAGQAGDTGVGWPVISIAAPLLQAGFNRVEVEFARDGRVLGLLIHRLRVDQGAGTVVAGPPQRVAIGARKHIDVKHREFFIEVIQSKGMSGEDLINLGAKPAHDMSADEVEDVVTEAVWSGVLESSSDSRDPFEWREFLFR